MEEKVAKLKAKIETVDKEMRNKLFDCLLEASESLKYESTFGIALVVGVAVV
jgi:hypothetical protein